MLDGSTGLSSGVGLFLSKDGWTLSVVVFRLDKGFQFGLSRRIQDQKWFLAKDALDQGWSFKRKSGSGSAALAALLNNIR